MQAYVSLLKKYLIRLSVAMWLGNLTVTAIILLVLSGIGFISWITGINRQWELIDNSPIVHALFLVVQWLTGAFLAAGCASVSLKAVSDGHNRISDFSIGGFRYFRKMIGFLFTLGLTGLIPVALFLASFWLLLHEEIFWGVALILPGVLLLISLAMAFLHAPLIVIHENVRSERRCPCLSACSASGLVRFSSPPCLHFPHTFSLPERPVRGYFSGCGQQFI